MYAQNMDVDLFFSKGAFAWKPVNFRGYFLGASRLFMASLIEKRFLLIENRSLLIERLSLVIGSRSLPIESRSLATNPTSKVNRESALYRQEYWGLSFIALWAASYFRCGQLDAPNSFMPINRYLRSRHRRQQLIEEVIKR